MISICIGHGWAYIVTELDCDFREATTCLVNVCFPQCGDISVQEKQFAAKDGLSHSPPVVSKQLHVRFYSPVYGVMAF